MNSLLDSLNSFIKSAKTPERRMIRHPHESEIIEHSLNELRQCATGTVLVEFMEHNAVILNILRGRYHRNFVTNKDTAYVSIPESVTYDSPESVILVAGSLREAMQEYDQMLKKVGVEQGETIYVHREEKRHENKLFWKSAIVYELGVLKNHLEYVEAFNMMGYASLLEAYQEDMESKEKGTE